MAWINAITDWDGVTTNRKYYNFGDLNRVENNTEYLKDTFLSVAGYVTTITTILKTRNNTRFEFYDDINRVESNILALKEASYEPVGWITPKTTWQDLDLFDYNDANRLEQNLSALKLMIENIEAGLLWCGVVICGGGNTAL